MSIVIINTGKKFPGKCCPRFVVNCHSLLISLLLVGFDPATRKQLEWFHFRWDWTNKPYRFENLVCSLWNNVLPNRGGSSTAASLGWPANGWRWRLVSSFDNNLRIKVILGLIIVQTLKARYNLEKHFWRDFIYFKWFLYNEWKWIL